MSFSVTFERWCDSWILQEDSQPFPTLSACAASCHPCPASTPSREASSALENYSFAVRVPLVLPHGHSFLHPKLHTLNRLLKCHGHTVTHDLFARAAQHDG